MLSVKFKIIQAVAREHRIHATYGISLLNQK